jgi:hypothetical protein
MRHTKRFSAAPLVQRCAKTQKIFFRRLAQATISQFVDGTASGEDKSLNQIDALYRRRDGRVPPSQAVADQQ